LQSNPYTYRNLFLECRCFASFSFPLSCYNSWPDLHYLCPNSQRNDFAACWLSRLYLLDIDFSWRCLLPFWFSITGPASGQYASWPEAIGIEDMHANSVVSALIGSWILRLGVPARADSSSPNCTTRPDGTSRLLLAICS